MFIYIINTKIIKVNNENNLSVFSLYFVKNTLNAWNMSFSTNILR